MMTNDGFKVIVLPALKFSFSAFPFLPVERRPPHPPLSCPLSRSAAPYGVHVALDSKTSTQDVVQEHHLSAAMHSQGRSGGCILLACLSMLALTAWQVLQAHHEAPQEQLATQKLSIQFRWQEGEDSAPVRGSATRQVQAAGLERFSRKGSASILRMRKAQEDDTQEAMTVSSAASRRSVMDLWDGQQQYIGIGQEQPSGSGSQNSHSSGRGMYGQGGQFSSSDGQLISKSWVLPAAAEVSNLTDTGNLPNNFDWQAYLAYYPDLLQSGIYSESQAQEHFLEYGRQEGRIYKRLKVLMHYTACTGLINQHYSHIAAFTLASRIGAELVLPPALQRDSFGSYFSTFKEQNEVTWTPTSLSLLLDVDRVIEEWRAHGMEVHKTPELVGPLDLGEPDRAWPMHQQSEAEEWATVRLTDIYLKAWDLPELVERVRTAVVEHAMAMAWAQPDVPIDHINLCLPCTFFMLRSASDVPRATMVARTLFFAPLLTGLADEIVAGMETAGVETFNSLHLRIEKDAKDWSMIMGGAGVLWQAYATAMQEAGFDEATPLYAASGLLTYGATQDMVDAEAMLTGMRSCSGVHTKEMYLPKEVLDGLASEQKALVDFLVLARGARYVGFGSSTFSFFLREYRTLQGLPRSSSVLVDASIIGTDVLFNTAAVVV